MGKRRASKAPAASDAPEVLPISNVLALPAAIDEVPEEHPTTILHEPACSMPLEYAKPAERPCLPVDKSELVAPRTTARSRRNKSSEARRGD